MLVLITCKNEDPIQNESARVVTTLNIDFRSSSDANSVVSSGMGRYSNSSKLSWLSLLPARMRKIHSKI